MLFFPNVALILAESVSLISVASSNLPADIGGNVINITIVITSESCTDGKYNQSSSLMKLKELVNIFIGQKSSILSYSALSLSTISSAAAV